MALFEAILAMLVAALLLSALARRIGVPYPSLLALAGAALALSPIEVPLHVDPALALALFVAPVLLDAAYDASIRDLRQMWLPICGLVFAAVGVTTVAVALVARAIVPGLDWAPAIALGAIVAPPDAAAATTVLRQVRLPHRLGIVLEGESLLNDATALLVYRLAVTATMAGGTIGAAAIAPAFLLGIVGSLVAGPLVALFTMRIMTRIDEAASSIIAQFVFTFGIWIAAERLGLSPILTVVAYAMTVARHSPATMPARLRVPSYAVWDVAVLVLNALAFVIIGLQLGPIIVAASPAQRTEWLQVAAAILATVIVSRLGWAFLYNGGERLVGGPREPGQIHRPKWRGSLAVSWCGMRGIVTLAAALALPLSFPHRELMLFVAFAVVLGTLVIQGMTLRPLLASLRLRDDEPVEREVREARAAMAEAALDAIDGHRGGEADKLRRELEMEREAAVSECGDGTVELPSQPLMIETLRARRETLIRLRLTHAIGDDAFHRLEEELDYADLAAGRPG